MGFWLDARGPKTTARRQEAVAAERKALREQKKAKGRWGGRDTLPTETVRETLEAQIVELEGPVAVLMPIDPIPATPDFGFMVVVIRGSDWKRSATLVTVGERTNIQLYPPTLWLDTGAAPSGEIADYETELAAWNQLIDETEQDDDDGAEGDVGAESPAADPYDALARLAELRDAGVLTEEEFIEKKREILGRL